MHRSYFRAQSADNPARNFALSFCSFFWNEYRSYPPMLLDGCFADLSLIRIPSTSPSDLDCDSIFADARSAYFCFSLSFSLFFGPNARIRAASMCRGMWEIERFGGLSRTVIAAPELLTTIEPPQSYARSVKEEIGLAIRYRLRLI